jgi:hypothetical protein
MNIRPIKREKLIGRVLSEHLGRQEQVINIPNILLNLRLRPVHMQSLVWEKYVPSSQLLYASMNSLRAEKRINLHLVISYRLEN